MTSMLLGLSHWILNCNSMKWVLFFPIFQMGKLRLVLSKIPEIIQLELILETREVSLQSLLFYHYDMKTQIWMCIQEQWIGMPIYAQHFLVFWDTELTKQRRLHISWSWHAGRGRRQTNVRMETWTMEKVQSKVGGGGVVRRGLV